MRVFFSHSVDQAVDTMSPVHRAKLVFFALHTCTGSLPMFCCHEPIHLLCETTLGCISSLPGDFFVECVPFNYITDLIIVDLSIEVKLSEMRGSGEPELQLRVSRSKPETLQCKSTLARDIAPASPGGTLALNPQTSAFVKLSWLELDATPPASSSDPNIQPSLPTKK